MADLIFYMKPGCKTNTGQLAALKAQGLVVEVRDLLREPWTAPSLRSFFGQKPVSAWINPFAPRVKSGEIQADQLSPDDALENMINDPYLIRRPLISNSKGKIVGFAEADLISIGIRLDADEKVSSACSAPERSCPEPTVVEA